MGINPEPLYGLPRLSSYRRCPGGIQRQVNVQPICIARRLLRRSQNHMRPTYRNFFPACSLAIYRHSISQRRLGPQPIAAPRTRRSVCVRVNRRWRACRHVATATIEGSGDPFRSISTQKLAEHLEDADVVIVDVREMAAFNGWTLLGEARGGQLPGAVAFPLRWLAGALFVDPVCLPEYSQCVVRS